MIATATNLQRVSMCGPAAGISSTCRTAYIRPLRHDDGHLLDWIMAGLGGRSRYQRFLSPKPRLTKADRAYLTSVDDHDHLALIAFTAAGVPLGVAHAVRSSDDPAEAELGVSVVDARQHERLGTELARRLARRAVAVGIERLVAQVVADSPLVDGLLRRGWHVAEQDAHTLTLAIDAWRVAARLTEGDAAVPRGR